MSSLDHFQENSFHVFFETTAKNYISNRKKAVRLRQSREISYDAVANYEEFLPVHNDTYCKYQKIFFVMDIAVSIENEMLGECLQYVVPSRRNVILLSFFAGYSNSRIARLLKVSNTTVAYRLRVGLQELKEQMERRKQCEEACSV